MQTLVGDQSGDKVGPVTPGFLIEFSSEVTRIIRARQEAGAETSLASVAERALTAMLDSNSASAVIAIVGRDSLEDPQTFAEKMTVIFGFGSRMILERIRDQARSECEALGD